MSSCSRNIMAVVHTTEALARAMAPVKMVVSSFLNADADAEKESPDATDSQGRFVSLLLSFAEQNSDGRNRVIHDYQNIDWKSIDFLPSRRYVQKLVQCFVSTLEERNIELEDDSLASLVCHFSMAGGCKHDINVPAQHTLAFQHLAYLYQQAMLIGRRQHHNQQCKKIFCISERILTTTMWECQKYGKQEHV